ncbi:MAG: hypothetical protein CMN79_00940 [Spirochaetales bacterium]|jgi:F-type H+-transporting ATPase subunit b|nr:hypothetical protein [Spirochaetales bacterium]
MAEELNIVGQLIFASKHLFNLIIFIGVLYYFLKKPISDFFSSRSLKIRNEIDEASRIIESAQKSYDKNLEKMNVIDSELDNLRHSIDLITNKKVSEITGNANSVASKIRNDTIEIIELESIKLKNDIQAEVLKKAIELAQHEMRTDIDDYKDTKLISKFFEEVKQNAVSNG